MNNNSIVSESRWLIIEAFKWREIKLLVANLFFNVLSSVHGFACDRLVCGLILHWASESGDHLRCHGHTGVLRTCVSQVSCSASIQVSPAGCRECSTSTSVPSMSAAGSTASSLWLPSALQMSAQSTSALTRCANYHTPACQFSVATCKTHLLFIHLWTDLIIIGHSNPPCYVLTYFDIHQWHDTRTQHVCAKVSVVSEAV